MPTANTGVGPGFDTPLPPGGVTIPAPGAPTTVPAAPIGPPIPGSTPPAQPRVATDLRAERDNVQKQLNELQAKIASGKGDYATAGQASAPESTLIGSYNARLTQLSADIARFEGATQAPNLVSGGKEGDQWNVYAKPDGTVDVQPNPNWNQKAPGVQTVTIGDHIVSVGPDGKATVAYTNTDAQQLADRQTSVAEANSKTAALAQQTNDYAARAKIELDERVSKGEDAASIRAEQAQKLAELHEQWVQADGDARRQQEALRDYNTERHQTAADTLSQAALDNTKQWQAMQDATTQRGQDIAARTAAAQTAAQSASAAAATRASLANARLQAGQGYMGNTLDMLSKMNAAAPPGSSAVGDMLIPLMNLGQQYFSNLGGLGRPEDVLQGGPTTEPTSAPVPPTTPGLNAPITPASMPVAPDLSASLPANPTSPAPAGMPDWYTAWQQRQAADAAAQLAATNAGLGTVPTPFTQSGFPEGVPRFARGGIVTRPTLAVVGDAGPEAITPLGPTPPNVAPTPPAAPLPAPAPLAAALPAPPPPDGAAGLAAVQSFLQGLEQLLGLANGQAAMAGQGAAALGHPPTAAANPMIPGTAVPGVPPAAAAAQAQARPLAPDGSPYATPQDVAQAFAARRSAAAAPAGTPQSQGLAPAGVGG